MNDRQWQIDFERICNRMIDRDNHIGMFPQPAVNQTGAPTGSRGTLSAAPDDRTPASDDDTNSKKKAKP